MSGSRRLLGNLLLALARSTGSGTPPMRDATGALSRPYYDFDSHWNRFGHNIAGEHVDGFLRRQGWDVAR